jgi:uncharacterized protein
MKAICNHETLDRFDDRGTYTTYYGMEQIGTIRFRCFEDGSYVGRSTVSIGGESARAVLRVEADKRGVWCRTLQESSLATVRTERTGNKVTITSGDDRVTLRVRGDTFLHESSAPALISHVIRAYGRDATRRRTFSVLGLPANLASSVLQRQRRLVQSLGRRRIDVELFSYEMSGTQLFVWADTHGRVLMVSAPAYATAYVRKGYRALHREHVLRDVPGDQLRAPRVEDAVRVKMRDGTALATTIYLPAREGRYPGIVIRTPYGRPVEDLYARFFARHGYAVAVQNVRGRYASEGRWHPFVHEGADGFDTIEWMAGQPWCTGKIGMAGGSYSALVQWMAAIERPPHLDAIVPLASPSDPFDAIPYDHGVFSISGAIWWLDITAKEATTDLSGATLMRASLRNWAELFKELPVIDLDVKVLGRRDVVFRKWIRHNSRDRYWRRAAFIDRVEQVETPVFHQAAAFDPLTSSTLRNYRELRARGRQGQRLVIGPWLHWGEARKVGGRDFGPAAMFDLRRATLRWFDWHLKGEAGGVTTEPAVHLFITGLNRWVTGQEYPLSATQFEPWYLHAASDKQSDGTLDQRTPGQTRIASTYTYDPGDPTPEGEPLGYPHKRSSTRSLRRLLSAWRRTAAKPARTDLLRFSTKRFDGRKTFVGPVSLRLWAASSAVDTDWHVRLFEVDTDDTAFAIAQGRIRARYRQSFSLPRLLEAGEICEYTIDLGHIGVSLDRGSRLQLVVASAAYPTYSRNLNTGGHNEVEVDYVTARQTIYHDRGRPSYLLLPAVPEQALTDAGGGHA